MPDCTVHIEAYRAEVNRLASTCINQCYNLANKWGKHLDKDERGDLASEAFLGMMRAAEMFCTSNKTAFITYGTIWAVSFIRRWLYRRSRLGIVGGIGKEVTQKRHAVGEHEVINTVELLEGQNEPVDARLHRSDLDQVMRCLPPRERSIVVWRFYEDRTLKECADMLGITRERIRQLQLKALAKLKREIGRTVPSMILLPPKKKRRRRLRRTA